MQACRAQTPLGQDGAVPEDHEPDPVDTAVLASLQARDGRLTYVVLDDGRRFRTFNIAWGYDIGDCFADITTNISPAVAGEALDFFFTNEVAALLDELGDPSSHRRASDRFEVGTGSAAVRVPRGSP